MAEHRGPHCEPPRERRVWRNMVWSCPTCERLWALRMNTSWATTTWEWKPLVRREAGQ